MLTLATAGAVGLIVSPQAEAVDLATEGIAFEADFQNVSAPDTLLRGFADSQGNTLMGDAYWNGTRAGTCNGVLVQGNYDGGAIDAWNCNPAEATSEEAAQANAAAYYGMQKLARGLQLFANEQDGTRIKLSENNALAHLTFGADAAAGETLLLGSNETGVKVTEGHYYALQVDYAAYCDASAPRIELWLDGKRVSEAIDICAVQGGATASATYASHAELNPADHAELVSAAGDGADAYNDRGVTVVRLTSQVVVSAADAMRVEVRNANTASVGNEGAIDNVQLVDVTPSVSAKFANPTMVAGASTTLTYDIANSVDNAAKEGWSFTHTLPAGLVVADPNGASVTCVDPGQRATTASDSISVTATPGSGTVTVSGDLSAATATCSVSVAVTAATAGTYALAADDLTGDVVNAVEASSLEVTAAPTTEEAPTSPAASATETPATETPTAQPNPTTQPAESASPSATATPAPTATPAQSPDAPAAPVAGQPTDTDIVADPVRPGEASTATMVPGADPASVALVPTSGATDVAADKRSFTDPATGVRFTVAAESGNITATPPAAFSGIVPVIGYTAKTTAGTAFTGTATFPNGVGPLLRSVSMAGTADVDRSTVFPAPSGIQAGTMSLLTVDGAAVKTLTIEGMATYVVNADGSVTATRATGFTGVLSSVPFRAQGAGSVPVDGLVTFDSLNAREIAPAVAPATASRFTPSPAIDPTTVTLVPPTGATSVAADGKSYASAEGVTYAVDPASGVINVRTPGGYAGPAPSAQYKSTITGGGNVSSTVFFPLRDYNLSAPAAAAGDISTSPAPQGLLPSSIRVIDPNAGIGVTAFDDVANGVSYSVDSNTGQVTAVPRDNRVYTIPSVTYYGASADGTRATGVIRFSVSGTETVAPEVRAGSNSVAPAPDGIITRTLRLINPETRQQVRSFTDPSTGIVYYVAPDNSGQIYTQVPAGYRGVTPSIGYSAFTNSFDLFQGVAKFPTTNVDVFAPAAPLGDGGTAPMPQFAIASTLKLVASSDATDVSADGRAYTSADGVRYQIRPNGTFTATPPEGYSVVIPAAQYVGQSAGNSDFSGFARFPAMGVNIQADLGNDPQNPQSTLQLFVGANPSSMTIKDPVTGVVGKGPYTNQDGRVRYSIEAATGAVRAEAISDTFNLVKPAIEYAAQTQDGTPVSGLARFPLQRYDVSAPVSTGSFSSTAEPRSDVVPESVKVWAGAGDFLTDSNFAQSATINAMQYSVNAEGAVTITVPSGHTGERPRIAYLGYTVDGTRVVGWANFPITTDRMTAIPGPMGQRLETGPAIDLIHSSMQFVPPVGSINVAADRRSFEDPSTRITYSFSDRGTVIATPPPGYVGAVPSVMTSATRESTGAFVPFVTRFPNSDLKIHTTQVGPFNEVTTAVIKGIDLGTFAFVIPEGATSVRPDHKEYSITGPSGGTVRYLLNTDGSVTMTPPSDNMGPVPTAHFTAVTTDGVQPVTGSLIFDVVDAFVVAPHEVPGAPSSTSALTGVNADSIRFVIPAGATEVGADQRSFTDPNTLIRFTVSAGGEIVATPPGDYLDAKPPVAFTARSADPTDPAQVTGMAMFNARDVRMFSAFANLGQATVAPGPSRTVPTTLTFDVDPAAGGTLSADKRTYTSADGVRYVIEQQGQVTVTPPANYAKLIEPINFRGQQLGLSDNPDYWSEVVGTYVFRTDNYNLVSEPSAIGEATVPVTTSLFAPASNCAAKTDEGGWLCLIDPASGGLTNDFTDATTQVRYTVDSTGHVVATPPTGWTGLIPPVRYHSVTDNGLSVVLGQVAFSVKDYDVEASPVLVGVPSRIPALDGVDPASLEFIGADGRVLGSTYTDPESGVQYELQPNGSVIATQPENFQGLISALQYRAKSDTGAIVSGTLFFPRGDLALTAEPVQIGAPATTPVPQVAACAAPSPTSPVVSGDATDAANATNAASAPTTAATCDTTNRFALIDPVTGGEVDTYTDSETQVVYQVNADDSVTATPPAGYLGAVPAAQFAMIAEDGTHNYGVARFPVKGLVTVGPGGTGGEPQTAPKLDGIDAATMEFILPEGAQQATPDRRHYLSADGLVQYDLLDSGAITATPQRGFVGPIPGANWQARAEDETPLYGEARFPFTNQVQACVARGQGVQGTVDIMANGSFKDLTVQPTTTVLIDPATSRPTTARTVTSVDGLVTYSLNNSGFISASTENSEVDIQPVGFMVFDANKSPYSGVVDFVSNAECSLQYRIYENRTVVSNTDKTTLVAWNLAAESRYSVYLMSDPVLVTEFTTDKTGAARIDVQVPVGTAPGLHHWVVRDEDGELVGSLPVQLLGQEGVVSGVLPDGVALPGVVPVQNPVQSPLGGGTIIVGQPTYIQVPGQVVQGQYRPRTIEAGVPGMLAATGVDATSGLLLGGLALLFGAGLVVVSRRQRRESKQ
ncbi:LPXTG cell wall anchor domain-containing protein [Micrococcales bacterium 31B]|nr:LPXTG cell wall anchor domain-containing protein [Micrococcales bacterium 31B]